MSEGVAVADGAIVGEAALDDRKKEPAPDAVNAPLGWTWDRSEGRWRPKKPRGRAAVKAKAAGEPVSGPVKEESGDLPLRDPDPAWAVAPEGGKRRKRSVQDVPKQVQDDIAGLGGLVATPILAMIQSVDPYCGGALAASFEGVMDATLPLICRSEKIVKYFSEDQADWLLWGKLAMALAPVGKAVLEHHVLRTVQVVRDERGQPQVVRRVRGGDEGDHLVPPVQSEFNYAA